MATLFRQPLIQKIERVKPESSVINSEAAVWQNPLLGVLKGKDTFFAGPGVGPDYDWPNPRGPVPAISLRTWTQELRLELLGQDKFYGAAGEAPSYDWQNPRGYTPAIDLRSLGGNLLETTLASTQAPFYLLDWPNPRAYVPGIDIRTQINDLLQSTLAFPFNPLDWPNPSGPIPAVILRTWTDALKLQLLGQDQFFNAAGMGPVYDWPNPKGRVPCIDLITQSLDLLQTTLAPSAPPPPPTTPGQNNAVSFMRRWELQGVRPRI